VYLAESPSGALLEVLVHLELDVTHPPKSYRLLKAEAPDHLASMRVGEKALPKNWTSDVVATRTVGDEWLAAGKAALLRVPSAIVPETFNILLNPQHADVRRIKVLWHEEYPWDSRLFGKSRGSR
jgi:RES domain-containing protein